MSDETEEDKKCVVMIKEEDFGKVYVHVCCGKETIIKVERYPKLKNPKWKDEEGNEIETCLLGETICLSVEYENINEEDTMIFTIYRSEGTNEKKYKAETENINKSITNSGNGTCEVQWTYKSLESRNNLKVYFTAYIEKYPDKKRTSKVINISNDCTCQSFFDTNENKYNKHGLKPQITDNTYNAHCDIKAWNQALESGYDPRGYNFDYEDNITKFSWDANKETVATLYTKYFSRYNNVRKNPLARRTAVSNNFIRYFINKSSGPFRPEYTEVYKGVNAHKPPAGTAGFIFFKNDKGVFDHIEFYDYTTGRIKFSRYQTYGIRQVKLMREDEGRDDSRYYVPLDKF